MGHVAAAMPADNGAARGFQENNPTAAVNKFRIELSWLLCSLVPSELNAVREFDALTDKTKGALSDMKRTYSLKLFAGGEETQALFASLSAELKALTK